MPINIPFTVIKPEPVPTSPSFILLFNCKRFSKFLFKKIVEQHIKQLAGRSKTQTLTGMYDNGWILKEHSRNGRTQSNLVLLCQQGCYSIELHPYRICFCKVHALLNIQVHKAHGPNWLLKSIAQSFVPHY